MLTTYYLSGSTKSPSLNFQQKSVLNDLKSHLEAYNPESHKQPGLIIETIE